MNLIPVQECYAEDKRVWNAIFERVVQDLAMAQREGIPLGHGSDQRVYPIILGNKGDWSYLDTWR